MEHSNTRSGFTLVELSIVLVIIGLIVSSVLVGQDLVRQAELRSTVTQYEQFQAAVQTFRTKYNALPGDLDGNSDYGWAAADGDNDNVLDGIAGGLATGSDNVLFWNNLGASGAGLISGTYNGLGVTATGGTDNIADVLPASDAGNYWGVYAASGINYYVLGVVGPATAGQYITALTLLPADALSMDTKIDDGRPGRGIVTAQGVFANAIEAAPIGAAIGDTGTNCIFEAGSVVADAAYNTQESSAACTLSMRL